MGRRIIGQCSTKDFHDLEHLSDLVQQQPGQIFMDNLTNTQKAAVRVLCHLQTCGVPFNTALQLREVLIWEMPDGGLAFEYKLLDPRDMDTKKLLLAMAPMKVNQHG